MSGGGSSGSGQTVAYQTNIPEYAAPYFEKLIGQAGAITQAPYQPYTGERIAQFTPLQQQAFAGTQQRQATPQLGAAAQIAQAAALQGMGQQYNPSAFTAQQITPGQITPGQVSAGSFGFERVGPGQVGTQAFTSPGAAQAYMSPYMQNVVDIQQREAQRQADIARTQRGAQAVGQGAFGGSRQAIMDAEAARNLAMQKGDIQAQGLQSAFSTGREAFMQDQARALQAQQTNLDSVMRAQQLNQQAGLTTGAAGLDAYMRAQLANQQAGLTAGQTNLQSSMQAQQQNQQAALEAQRMAEQSRQFGFGAGMQGAQTALQGAQQLGALGQQLFAQESDILGQKAAMGAQQQAQVQNILGQQYSDFMAQRNYPYQQLGFISDILRGAQGTSRTMYSPAPSPMQNLAALGGAAMGVSKIAGMKKGGRVPAAGLQDLALARMKESK